MEIGCYMVLSTAHIRCATGQTLTSWAGLAVYSQPLLVASMPHGWFLSTLRPPADVQKALPEELPAILAFGRLHDCAYVLLDSDGPVDPWLPIFAW